MGRNDSQPRFISITLVSAIALVAFHYLGILQPVERILLTGLQPIGRVVIRFTHAADGTLRGASSDTRDTAALQDRVADLSAENAALRSALSAATEASEQQAFLRDRSLAGIQARVFARSSDPTSQVVAIDAGTTDGISIGAPAIVRNGILIGRVISAEATSAQILLTVDNRSSLTAVMADNPIAQGVVHGVRGLSLSMNLIPQTEALSPGEIAVSAGTDVNVPPGLILGELERFEKLQGAVLQSASLRPLYNVSRLDAVTILTGIRQ